MEDIHPRMALAANRLKVDRYGLEHVKSACPADINRRGYVPGVAYQTAVGPLFEVLGYTVDGSVVVEMNGEVKTWPYTRVDRHSRPQFVTKLGIKLSGRPN